METDKLIALLLKAVDRHERMLGLVTNLAVVVADHAQLVERTLERCACTGCTDAVTVRHAFLGLKCCDACAARLIIKASQNITSDANDELNLTRTAVANEGCWIDLPDAAQVRRLQDYLAIVKRDDDPGAPGEDQLLQ